MPASRRALTLLLCLAAAPAAAQTLGRSTFHVFENGTRIGSIEMTLSATDEGWRLQGRSRLEGPTPVDIPNLDLHYDEWWRGRFMTMEMKAPDAAIVHVAVVNGTTRTDVVRETEARFRSHSVSPDTIFLPERAYGAYEAVAVRLAAGAPGSDLPLFIVPLGETRARVDEVEDVEVRTRAGPVMATRYLLTEIRERPTPVELWVAEARLLRLDIPRAGLSIVRDDIVR